MEKYYFKIDYKETASGPTKIIYISMELDRNTVEFLINDKIDTLIRNKLFYENRNINIVYLIESVREEDIPLKRDFTPRIAFEY